MISRSMSFSRRAGSLLLVGTVLGGSAAPLLAQTAPQPTAPPAAAAPAPAPPAAPVERTIRSVTVRGNQRLEPETIRAYANLSPGQTYTAATLDQAIKDLYATQLFADATISGTETGNLVINVRENPVSNRIVLEGNKRLKSDKIMPEIKLAPRQIFTRSAVRSDVDRILTDTQDDIARFGTADGDIGEQVARIEVLDRLIERLVGIGLADAELGVGEHGIGFDAL